MGYLDKYKLTFIVEGESDAKVVKRAIHDLVYLKEVNKNPLHLRQCRDAVNIIITRGTHFGEREKLQIEIDILLGSRIFILTDPDKSGDELAQAIQQKFPIIPRIELNPLRCINTRSPKKNKGVEYCDIRYLRNIINRYMLKFYDMDTLQSYTKGKKLTTLSKKLRKYNS